MRMNIFKFEEKIRTINTDYLTDEEFRETIEEEALIGHRMEFELVEEYRESRSK